MSQGIMDEVGVILPPWVAQRNAQTRARYKAKRNLRLTETEKLALVRLENNRAMRMAKKTRTKEAVREAKQQQIEAWKAIGYPCTKAAQELMVAFLALELEEGVLDRAEQANRLGISYQRLVNFINNHRKYYMARVDEHLRDERKRLEERIAQERIVSIRRLLATNKRADEIIAEVLSPESDASPAVQQKYIKMIKDTIGVSREEMREDQKVEMAKERQAVELDTIRLLASRGRLQAEARKLPADIPTEAEVVKENE